MLRGFQNWKEENWPCLTSRTSAKNFSAILFETCIKLSAWFLSKHTPCGLDHSCMTTAISFSSGENKKSSTETDVCSRIVKNSYSRENRIFRTAKSRGPRRIPRRIRIIIRAGRSLNISRVCSLEDFTMRNIAAHVVDRKYQEISELSCWERAYPRKDKPSRMWQVGTSWKRVRNPSDTYNRSAQFIYRRTAAEINLWVVTGKSTRGDQCEYFMSTVWRDSIISRAYYYRDFTICFIEIFAQLFSYVTVAFHFRVPLSRRSNIDIFNFSFKLSTSNSTAQNLIPIIIF